MFVVFVLFYKTGMRMCQNWHRVESSERTQSAGNMSFATSPRSFILELFSQSPPIMVGLPTKASSPTTSHFDTPLSYYHVLFALFAVFNMA